VQQRRFIVVIAIEVLSPKGFGRARLQRVNDVSGASLVPFVSAAVEHGSEVRTDGWKGYNSLTEKGYRRDAIKVSSTGDPAHVSMPGVHKVASLLKRWLLGTHQGSVTGEHLDAYLNEFAFRFNRRHSRRRGLLFLRLLQYAVVTPPTRYRPSRSRTQTQKHNRKETLYSGSYPTLLFIVIREIAYQNAAAQTHGEQNRQ
jgi:transposase-like protein